MHITDINEIMRTLNISASNTELLTESDDIISYRINSSYILKISTSTLAEQIKLNRVKSLKLAPKIHMSGSLCISDCEYHYMMIDYMQGHELWKVAQSLTDEAKYNIGKEIAQFLNELHMITGDYYDIGHYIPTIPMCTKSWKEGHLDYAAILQKGILKMDIEPDNQKIISRAFDYIHANINALDYQAGAKLLHNDFHPKNIIVNDNRLTGVIDWECSQYGEADFELSRMIDWCIYPEKYLPQGNNFEILLKSIIEALQLTTTIPDIEKRFTIYQLEQEINQLIWHGKKQEEERISRVIGWLDGKINGFLMQ